jgi:hypothetical protein
MAKRKHPADSDKLHGNPFKGKHAKALGNVLLAEDVSEDPGNLDDFDLLHWSRDHVYVLLHNSQVRAVVVHQAHAGGSARGVSVGDSEDVLQDKYPEQPDIRSFRVKDGERGAALFPALDAAVFSSSPPGGRQREAQWGKAFRYATLGIGFEVVENKVSAITLFPPKENEASLAASFDPRP